jgi:hypothetical protein
MENECVAKVKDQVQEELKAAMTYLAMVPKILLDIHNNRADVHTK